MFLKGKHLCQDVVGQRDADVVFLWGRRQWGEFVSRKLGAIFGRFASDGEGPENHPSTQGGAEVADAAEIILMTTSFKLFDGGSVGCSKLGVVASEHREHQRKNRSNSVGGNEVVHCKLGDLRQIGA